MAIIALITATLALKYNGRPIIQVLASMFGHPETAYLRVAPQEEIEIRGSGLQKHASPLQSLWLRINAGKELISSAKIPPKTGRPV